MSPKLKSTIHVANSTRFCLGLTFFGLIRTAVGTDANVDILQLDSRASGLTEVAAILAEHPEWDNGTQRLTLPPISQQGGEITSKVDHISPKDWHSDANVARVNLHTCWLLGCKEAIDALPEAGPVFKQLLAEGSADINMLSPLGTLLVNQRDGGEDDLDKLIHERPDDAMHPTEDLDGACASVSYTHEGDLEDAMADEMP